MKLAVGCHAVGGITQLTFRQATRTVILFVRTERQCRSKSFITDFASTRFDEVKVGLLTRTIVRGHQFPSKLKKLDVGTE